MLLGQAIDVAIDRAKASQGRQAGYQSSRPRGLDTAAAEYVELASYFRERSEEQSAGKETWEAASHACVWMAAHSMDDIRSHELLDKVLNLVGQQPRLGFPVG